MIYSIVVTYNGEQWINKCLSSLENSDVEQHHIIVIDNGSTDNTVGIIQKDYPEIELIESGENLGFGQANNIGMKKALEDGADFVFLLNQDAWVEENTIRRLAEVSEKEPSYGIVSPMHFNGSGDRIDEKLFENLVKKDISRELFSNMYSNELKNIYDVKFINAAVWLVSIKCISSVGLFDPIFFHYGEDVNYSHRVNYHRFKVGIVPQIKAFHDRERSGRESISNYKYKMLLDAQLLATLCDVNSKSVAISYIRCFYYLVCNSVERQNRRFIIDLLYTFRSLFWIRKIKAVVKRTKKSIV